MAIELVEFSQEECSCIIVTSLAAKCDLASRAIVW